MSLFYVPTCTVTYQNPSSVSSTKLFYVFVLSFDLPEASCIRNAVNLLSSFYYYLTQERDSVCAVFFYFSSKQPWNDADMCMSTNSFIDKTEMF